MQTQSDELTEIRATIRQLQTREAELLKNLTVKRPGWPIQRITPQPSKPLH